MADINKELSSSDFSDSAPHAVADHYYFSAHPRPESSPTHSSSSQPNLPWCSMKNALHSYKRHKFFSFAFYGPAILCVNSWFSALSINGMLSLGVVNGFMSIGSINSSLSVGSINSFLSIGCRNGMFKCCMCGPQLDKADPQFVPLYGSTISPEDYDDGIDDVDEGDNDGDVPPLSDDVAVDILHDYYLVFSDMEDEHILADQMVELEKYLAANPNVIDDWMDLNALLIADGLFELSRNLEEMAFLMIEDTSLVNDILEDELVWYQRLGLDHLDLMVGNYVVSLYDWMGGWW